MNPESIENRRPLAIRQQAWVHKLARFLAGLGVTPNQVSGASLVFAVLGALAYAASCSTGGEVKAWLLVAAAAFIQLRLLCNLLDGIIAVEGGKHTPVGGIYNELPDRIADSLFLVTAGYAAGYGVLGWLAALLAVTTAYVRALGGSLGVKQDFSGPMAKQHRMHALTAGSVLMALFRAPIILAATLAIIALGSAWTVVQRVRNLANALNGEANVSAKSGG